MLRAALTGKMELDNNDQTLITPWIAEIAILITKLDHRSNTNIHVHLKIYEHKGMQWIWNCQDILKLDETLLLEDTGKRESDKHEIQTLTI